MMERNEAQRQGLHSFTSYLLLTNSHSFHVFISADDLRVKLQEKEHANKSATEEVNLFKLKTEVLMNMLAIEEGKNSVNEKKIEALKHALMHEQGITDQMDAEGIRALVNGSKEFSSSIVADLSDVNISFDLSGAISRMNTALGCNVRNSTQSLDQDIYSMFIDDKSNLIPVMMRDQFTDCLTKNFPSLTKTDADSLFFRFSDGKNVSTVEFLEFFGTSHTMRRNKAANAAVRMNLEASCIEYSSEDLKNALSPLQVAGKKFFGIFPAICDPLIAEFDKVTGSSDFILTVEKFRDIMNTMCGPSSRVLKSKGFAVKDSALTKENIILLSERFELGGKLDWSVFIDHFEGALSSSLGIDDPAYNLRVPQLVDPKKSKSKLEIDDKNIVDLSISSTKTDEVIISNGGQVEREENEGGALVEQSHAKGNNTTKSNPLPVTSDVKPTETLATPKLVGPAPISTPPAVQKSSRGCCGGGNVHDPAIDAPKGIDLSAKSSTFNSNIDSSPAKPSPVVDTSALILEIKELFVESGVSMDQYMETFHGEDKDNKGLVDCRVFKKTMNTFGVPLEDEEVEQLSTLCGDANHENFDYVKFMSLVIPGKLNANVDDPKAANKSNIKISQVDALIQEIRDMIVETYGESSRSIDEVSSVFRSIDKDGIGNVNKSEFGNAMKALKVPLEHAEIDAIFSFVDEDKIEALDYNNFIDILFVAVN